MDLRTNVAIEEEKAIDLSDTLTTIDIRRTATPSRSDVGSIEDKTVKKDLVERVERHIPYNGA